MREVKGRERVYGKVQGTTDGRTVDVEGRWGGKAEGCYCGVKLEVVYHKYCNSGRDLVRENGEGLVGLGNMSFILVISYNNQCNIVFFYVRGHYELTQFL